MKNRNVEPNTKSIGLRVAELWPFEVFTLRPELGDRISDAGHASDFIFCPMLLCSALETLSEQCVNLISVRSLLLCCLNAHVHHLSATQVAHSVTQVRWKE